MAATDRGHVLLRWKVAAQRMIVSLLVALCLIVAAPPGIARDWSGSPVDRGYVLNAEINRSSNPRRHCVPQMYAGMDRQAVLQAPAGGWPGEPQAVAVFNIHGGEVMIAHGADAICGQMHDMRTRDSRFRAGVGQVVVPRKGNTEPIIVAWQTPLLPEWVPTIRLGSPSHLQYEDTARLLLRAACMAVTVALALSALMGWLAVRELPFLYYAGSCLVLFLWQAMLNGLSGYPYPWFPFLDHLSQWHVQLSTFSTVLMLLGMAVLGGGQETGGRIARRAHWVIGLALLVSLLAFVLPLPGLRAMAVLPLVLLATGCSLVLMFTVVMLLRRRHEAVLGLVAIAPFLAIVVAEMGASRWWIEHRVECQQLAATWLLMMSAYALNRRLSLIRLQRDEMRRLADTDGLTGLPNRRFGMQRLRQLHGQARKDGKPLSVAFLDVDHFKSINDSCGHEAGDQVLVAVADLLTESVRAGDDVVRMGGEEFLLLLPGIGAEQAALRMEELRERVDLLPLSHLAPGLRVTVSIGVAQMQPNEGDADLLLRRADKAMYQAKQSGRNRVQRV